MVRFQIRVQVRSQTQSKLESLLVLRLEFRVSFRLGFGLGFGLEFRQPGSVSASDSDSPWVSISFIQRHCTSARKSCMQMLCLYTFAIAFWITVCDKIRFHLISLFQITHSLSCNQWFKTAGAKAAQEALHFIFILNLMDLVYYSIRI